MWFNCYGNSKGRRKTSFDEKEEEKEVAEESRPPSINMSQERRKMVAVHIHW